MRRVTVDMPERMWGRLASMADDRGVKIADLIESAISDLVPTPRTPLELLEHELKQARRNGWRATSKKVSK